MMKEMELKVLIDNNPHPKGEEVGLLTEHGLSFYVKVGEVSCLYDVGASDGWLSNAKAMGVKPENVDYLILSHGHNDHTGGLEHFLHINSKAEVIASERMLDYRYYSHRHEEAKDISIDVQLLFNEARHIRLVRDNYQLSPAINLVKNHSFEYLLPLGNSFLTTIESGIERIYKADDELAIAITIKEGLVILSSCSHNGMLNIIESCLDATKSKHVLAFIGGLHLVDSIEEEEEQVEIIAQQVVEKYPEMMLYTGHCTGKKAIAIFSRVMKERFKLFYTGMQLPF